MLAGHAKKHRYPRPERARGHHNTPQSEGCCIDPLKPAAAFVVIACCNLRPPSETAGRCWRSSAAVSAPHQSRLVSATRKPTLSRLRDSRSHPFGHRSAVASENPRQRAASTCIHVGPPQTFTLVFSKLPSVGDTVSSGIAVVHSTSCPLTLTPWVPFLEFSGVSGPVR
jgi:hypothetical protein